MDQLLRSEERTLIMREVDTGGAPPPTDQVFKCGKSRREAADYLREKFGQGSELALAKLASSPDGPEHYKFGKKVLYLESDLDRWALSRLRRVEPALTSEPIAE